MLVFQQDLYSFRTITQSMFTLMRALLGDFDYDAMWTSSPTMAPILFITFVFLAVIIMLNMFIGAPRGLSYVGRCAHDSFVVCVGIVSTALQNEQKELAEVSMISAPQLNRTTAGLTEDDTAALSGVYDTVPADGELA